jgi:hypothetical protein
MHPKNFAIPAALVVGLLSISPAANSPLQAQAGQQMPVSYICTMDADVVDDKPGSCPVCKMTLQAVRIESAFACPVHAVNIDDKPGLCKIDKRELVPVFINHFWDCGEVPEHLSADPRRCADGKPAVERRIVRAHGDHNPRHGGAFFMATDKWHHVEGTYPREGLFRLYMYDNFTQPLDMKGIVGRVFLREDGNRELDVTALKLSADGKTLEAAVKGGPLPFKVSAKIKFKPQVPEDRFDFVFPALSVEPASTPSPAVLTGAAKPAPAAPRTANAAPARASAPAAPPATPAPAAAAPPPAVGLTPDLAAPAQSLSRTEAEQMIQEMPSNTAELLKLLDLRSHEIKTLVDEGNFGMVWVPTMLAKEVALALGDHVNELPERQHASLTNAVRRLVLSAWRLDQYGDLGDREKITNAHNSFAAAAADIKAAYANR